MKRICNRGQNILKAAVEFFSEWFMSMEFDREEEYAFCMRAGKVSLELWFFMLHESLMFNTL